jgi:hypothetical protein
MPTIDIPDKICPHCGGTRWCIFQKKDWRSEKFHGTINYYTNYSCANVTENGCARLKRLKYNPLKPRVKVTKEYTKERVRKYHQKNKHKWHSQSKEVHNKRCKVYYKTNSEYKKRINDHQRKDCEVLSDAYIKRMITQHKSFLSYKDVPQDLVELKRKQLLLKRKIKNNGKKKIN